MKKILVILIAAFLGLSPDHAQTGTDVVTTSDFPNGLVMDGSNLYITLTDLNKIVKIEAGSRKRRLNSCYE